MDKNLVASITNVPAILWGSPADGVVIYVQGNPPVVVKTGKDGWSALVITGEDESSAVVFARIDTEVFMSQVIIPSSGGMVAVSELRPFPGLGTLLGLTSEPAHDEAPATVVVSSPVAVIVVPDPPVADPPAVVAPDPPVADPPAVVVPDPPVVVAPDPPAAAAVIPDPPVAVVVAPDPPAADPPAADPPVADPPAAAIPDPPATVIPDPPVVDPPVAVVPDPPVVDTVVPLVRPEWVDVNGQPSLDLALGAFVIDLSEVGIAEEALLSGRDPVAVIKAHRGG